MRLLLLLLLLLTACNSKPLVVETPAVSQVIFLAESSPVFAATLAISPPTPTFIPDPGTVAVDIPPPTLQPTDLPSFQMCSPLLLHPLAELPQVIGDPYDPPRPGREERHHGVDFAYYHYQDRDSMQAEPIQAVLAGVVAAALHDLYPYGNMVMVESSLEQLPPEVVDLLDFQTGESLYVLYAHMDLAPTLSIGDRVEACQPLGQVGMTGNTELPHLHLETRIGPVGSVFESMRYYDTRASLEELAAYELWRTSGIYRHFDPVILLSIPLEPPVSLPTNP